MDVRLVGSGRLALEPFQLGQFVGVRLAAPGLASQFGQAAGAAIRIIGLLARLVGKLTGLVSKLTGLVGLLTGLISLLAGLVGLFLGLRPRPLELVGSEEASAVGIVDHQIGTGE